MPKTKDQHESLSLKEACVQAAHEFIAEHGLERLSMREVARRLGVSHQAPYKHYASRDYLLAEVIKRCFENFGNYLDSRETFEDPEADLRSLGKRYFAYSATHPLEYRLMFGTPWPEPAVHTALVENAVRAFDVLRGVLRRMYGDSASMRTKVDLDAMYIWSNMHGLATIRQSNVMEHLKLAPKVSSTATDHIMNMMSLSIKASAG